MTAAPDVVPLRVVVADDHAPTRAGVRDALESDGCTVVAAVADATAAIVAAEEHMPSVACWTSTSRQRHRCRPGAGAPPAEPAIVMLTASADDDDLFESLRAGASGYLLKDMDPDRVAAALRGVLAGRGCSSTVAGVASHGAVRCGAAAADAVPASRGQRSSPKESALSSS
jgi:DNA-binding NarL/FixJ family response regulator